MDSRLYRDEKSKDENDNILLPELNTRKHPNIQQKHVKLIKVLITLCLLFVGWHSISLPTRNSDDSTVKNGSEDLEFEQITPSELLEWHPCRHGLFCARLTVPMDYNRPLNASSDNPKVHVALVLAPGKHSSNKEYSTSPMLINPGGPGGSGVMFVSYGANMLQNIVGLDQDIIGFDPRGIGATTPRADCFSPHKQNLTGDSLYDFGAVDAPEGFWQRILWQTVGRGVGLINTTSASLSQLDVRSRLEGKLCEEKAAINGDDSILKHLGTPNVARDMISIIDAWDKWIDSEQLRTSSKDSDSLEIGDRKYPLDTKGKLVYWGFSYGTLLGATFAGLFPDRVGRMILDGVVDADQYVAPVWTNSIVDADKILESFPTYCFEGKTRCPLYKENDTFEDLKSRFFEVQSNIKESPVSFISPYDGAPLILTYTDVKSIAFTSVYDPNHFGFWLLATMLDAIVRSDYQVLSQFYFILPKEEIGKAWPESAYPSDAQMAILCGDKRYLLNETIPKLQHRFEKMSKISSFADVWLSLMMGCDGWSVSQIDPPLRWGKHPVHKEKPYNTSFPLLFLSSTLDPVTPLRAAVKMALKFQDSGLIEQMSMGHCSLSAFSFCTLKKVKEYFAEGKVPSHPVPGNKEGSGDWERCEANDLPFKSVSETILFATDSEEMKIVTAAAELQKMLMHFHTDRISGRHGTAGGRKAWDRGSQLHRDLMREDL